MGPEHQRTPTSTAMSLLRSCRPKQWLKNGLVFAAPAAAGKLLVGSILLQSAWAAVFFILTSSGIYLLNDLKDISADQLHPTKSKRPIASGQLSKTTATTAAVLLLVSGNLLPLLLSNYRLSIVILSYSVVTLSYVFGLKHEAVFDIAAVAVGFLLRAMAGGVAANLPLSNWFLIVASFGSLFMVAGKRYSELVLLGEDAEGHRKALGAYTASYLNFIRATSAAVAITGYCVWAFDKASVSRGGSIWLELSILPFVLAILKYALVIEQGMAGAPEEVVLSNKSLLGIGAVWAAMLTVGILVYKG